MPLVEANGLTFHVSERGSGPPLVMLHGLLLGNMTTWYFSAAPRLAARYRVLLYDLRGHGRSERPATGYDLGTMAEDLGALAAVFTDEPLTLVGHSYGALVALRFALEHPQRAAALGLVEAPLPPSSFPEITRFLELPAEEMAAALPPQLKGSLESPGRRGRRMLDSLAQLSGGTTLIEDLGAEQDIPDEKLASLRCRVLALYGASSPCAGVGDRLVRTIPGCTLARMEGGHLLPLESPGEVGDRLEEFFHG